jgi:hypothetical protein
MNLTWQSLGLVHVPARPAGFWTLALEFVPASRLLRIRITDKDAEQHSVASVWSPAAGMECGPDGILPAASDTSKTAAPITQPNGSTPSMLCTSAAFGALIAKIGGSTADLPDSLTAPNTAPYSGKKVFAVGSDAIISIAAAADAGPLFLTMNDVPTNFPHHSGAFLVALSYYPL